MEKHKNTLKSDIIKEKLTKNVLLGSVNLHARLWSVYGYKLALIDKTFSSFKIKSIEKSLSIKMTLFPLVFFFQAFSVQIQTALKCLFRLEVNVH